MFDGGDLESFAQAVETAALAESGTLVIDEGTYRFDPLEQNPVVLPRVHARFERIEDLTIEGNGSTLLFTNPLIGTFEFRGGSDITIKDLAIDHDPVPFTQGTIRDRSRKPSTVRILLDDGFPELDHEMFAQASQVYALVHESDGQFIGGIRKQGTGDPQIRNMSKVGARQYNLEINETFQSGGLSPGRKLTVLARNDMGGLFFNYVSNPRLRDVSIHATNGGAFHFGVCESPDIRDCVVAPPEGATRHIGANADGIRIINCQSSARVEGCRHESLGDDGLVVQNTLAAVTSILDEMTVAVEEVHPFVVGTGDRLEVLSPTGVRKPSLPPIAEFQPRFPLPIDRAKPVTITFEESIENLLEEGDYLRNPATGSQNFLVRNNEFRDHRSNLIRIAASFGIVENNVFDGCPNYPIELETDTGSQIFSPKGWTSDVVVRNNTISRAGLALYAGTNPVGIHVHHRPGPKYRSEGKPNRNISIINNRITESAIGGIHIDSSENITISGNEMSGLNRMDLPQFTDIGVSLARVSGAELSENTVRGSSDSLDYFGTRRASRRVETAGNHLIIDGDSKPSKLVNLVPVDLTFNRTIQPSERDPDSSDDRPLAFRCREIELFGSVGNRLRHIDIGTDEGGVAFGTGVWSPSRDGEWRWFGGSTRTASLYFSDSELAEAASIRLRGYPIAEGISAEVIVDGEQTDTVRFDSGGVETYTLSLD